MVGVAVAEELVEAAGVLAGHDHALLVAALLAGHVPEAAPAGHAQALVTADTDNTESNGELFGIFAKLLIQREKKEKLRLFKNFGVSVLSCADQS